MFRMSRRWNLVLGVEGKPEGDEHKAKQWWTSVGILYSCGWQRSGSLQSERVSSAENMEFHIVTNNPFSLVDGKRLEPQCLGLVGCLRQIKGDSDALIMRGLTDTRTRASESLSEAFQRPSRPSLADCTIEFLLLSHLRSRRTMIHFD